MQIGIPARNALGNRSRSTEVAVPTFLQGLKILPSSRRRKQVTGRISTQHRDFAGCEIIIGGDDLELVFLDLLGEDR